MEIESNNGLPENLENFKRLKTSADFCHDCGDLLTLPLYSDFVECSKCRFKISLLRIEMKIMNC